MAYLAIEQFDKSIEDCDQAIALNKDFVKVISLLTIDQAYYRKALAYREKLDDERAIETLKDGLKLDPENEDIKTLLKEAEEEYKEDHNLPKDNPEVMRFDKMLKWLKDGGSQFDKLKIRYYAEDYRGVHAARDIRKGETILYVPKEQIITLEMAIASPVGSKMYEKGLRQRLISPKHSFLATYIMQEKRKESTIWDPYIDILPK